MESSLRKQLEMDEDDYWNQSNKFKRIFDDDEPSKKSRNLFDDDDDDDTERVDWAGDTVFSFSQLSAESARYRYPVKEKENPPAPTLKPKVDSFPIAAKSEAKNEKLTLADAVIRTDSPPQPSLKRESNLGTATEAAKLKAELNFQKRRANEAESSRWTSLPVDDTIKRILSGEVYTLETYKSLDEKLSLLDAAIQSRDGNALTAVVVFFHGSVKNNIFLTQMKSRPVALNHYLQYLRKTSRIPELIEAFGMFGLHEEAAILKFSLATKTKQPDQKIKSLKSCLRAHYLLDPVLAKDAALIQQQIQLLEVQQPINQSDSELAAKAKEAIQQRKAQQQQQQQAQESTPDLKLSPEIELFAKFPRPSTLVGLPLLTSLSYCCTYHFWRPASFFGSPEFYRKTFGFSEKQYAWVALKAHARQSRWEEIEKLLKPKSWFGKKKMDLDFRKVATLLAQQGADQRVIASYLWDVEDVDERLATALKIQCHMGVVDAYATAKDRVALDDYRRKLKGDDMLYAEQLLRNPKIKWKN